MIGYKKYLPHDLITIVYLSIIISMIIIFGRDLPKFWFHLSRHTLILILILLMVYFIKPYRNRFFKFIHYFYPLLLFTFLYQETGRLDNLFFHHYFDSILRNWDILIFGFSPSEKIVALFPNPWWSEYMHFAYFCYYLLIPGMWFYLFLKKQEKILKYTFTICLSFYFCYLFFIVFPAIGGRVYTNIYAQPGFLFTKLMDYIYRTQETNGGAFPSSHVALALVVLFYSSYINKKAFYILSVIILSLIVSTVYCGYHYAVDIFAGVLVGIVFYLLGTKIASKTEGGNENAP